LLAAASLGICTKEQSSYPEVAITVRQMRKAATWRIQETNAQQDEHKQAKADWGAASPFSDQQAAAILPSLSVCGSACV
jgi:hypothetical protein